MPGPSPPSSTYWRKRFSYGRRAAYAVASRRVARLTGSSSGVVRSRNRANEGGRRSWRFASAFRFDADRHRTDLRGVDRQGDDGYPIGVGRERQARLDGLGAFGKRPRLVDLAPGQRRQLREREVDTVAADDDPALRDLVAASVARGEGGEHLAGALTVALGLRDLGREHAAPPGRLRQLALQAEDLHRADDRQQERRRGRQRGGPEPAGVGPDPPPRDGAGRGFVSH